MSETLGIYKFYTNRVIFLTVCGVKLWGHLSTCSVSRGYTDTSLVHCIPNADPIKSLKASTL